MTAESLYKRALKASAANVEAADREADPNAAATWADTALTLARVAAEASVLMRVD